MLAPFEVIVCMPSPTYETEIRIRLMSGREMVANEMLVCEIYTPTCSKNTTVESYFERSGAKTINVF